MSCPCQIIFEPSWPKWDSRFRFHRKRNNTTISSSFSTQNMVFFRQLPLIYSRSFSPQFPSPFEICDNWLAIMRKRLSFFWKNPRNLFRQKEWSALVIKKSTSRGFPHPRQAIVFCIICHVEYSSGLIVYILSVIATIVLWGAWLCPRVYTGWHWKLNTY